MFWFWRMTFVLFCILLGMSLAAQTADTATIRGTVVDVDQAPNYLSPHCVSGTNNSGNTGAPTDRPVVNGIVVGRNTGRGKAIYSLDPSISRAFSLAHDAMQLQLRAEAFNVPNRANFVGYSGTYGNGTVPGIGFGAPSYGVTSQLPARFMQFSAEVSYEYKNARAYSD